jgi:hypothetical protein
VVPEILIKWQKKLKNEPKLDHFLGIYLVEAMWGFWCQKFVGKKKFEKIHFVVKKIHFWNR